MSDNQFEHRQNPEISVPEEVWKRVSIITKAVPLLRQAKEAQDIQQSNTAVHEFRRPHIPYLPPETIKSEPLDVPIPASAEDIEKARMAQEARDMLTDMPEGRNPLFELYEEKLDEAA